VGNRNLPRGRPANNLYAQLPTASGLTVFAQCSRSTSFVGLDYVRRWHAAHYFFASAAAAVFVSEKNPNLVMVY
jgi:hypothetical protein